MMRGADVRGVVELLDWWGRLNAETDAMVEYLAKRDELTAYITTIRNRTTNTVEEWNLMLQAERALEREGSSGHGH